MWLCFVIVLVFLLMIPIVFALERRRLKKAEAAFLAGRTEMTAQQFLQRMNAEPDLAPFYLDGRQAMASLCGVPGEMVRPEDTVQSLLDLQFDNGYIDDFVMALQRRVGGSLPMGYPPSKWTFAAYLEELGRHWRRLERIVVRIDTSQPVTLNQRLAGTLATRVTARSGRAIQVEQFYPSADSAAQLLWLRAERLEEALACVVEVVENIAAERDAVQRAVVVAVLRSGRYVVIYPRDFEGPFILSLSGSAIP